MSSHPHPSIQLPKERGRENQALQPPRHTYTRDTAVEQYTRSQAAAKKSSVEHHTHPFYYLRGVDKQTMSQGNSGAGPQMNWTKDNKVYQRYLLLRSSAEEIFSSILSKESEAEKCAYLHIWMGDDRYPLLMKWKARGKLKFDHKEEIRNHLGRVTTPSPQDTS